MKSEESYSCYAGLILLKTIIRLLLEPERRGSKQFQIYRVAFISSGSSIRPKPELLIDKFWSSAPL